MGDLDRVGGKNASLGEMIGSLAKLGVRVPGGFATTAHAFREFLAQDGLGGRIRAELATLDVDDVTRLAAAGARIRQWMLATPFPPALQQAVKDELRRMSGGAGHRRCRALLGHRGGPPGRLLRRPAGNLPQRPRRGAGAGGDARGVRLALQRPRHLLPRPQGLRSWRGSAIGGRAAHGAQRPRRERRHVHAGHRLRLSRRGVHNRLLRPRRDRGAGRGQPGRVLRLQARAAGRQARRAAPQPRRQGDQDGVRAARDRGSACSTVEVPEAERAALLPHRRGPDVRSPARRSSSRSTTASPWTSSGARTAPAARSSSCRRARRPCRAAPAARSSASP